MKMFVLEKIRMINCLVTMCTGMSSVTYCVYEYEKRGQREREILQKTTEWNKTNLYVHDSGLFVSAHLPFIFNIIV